MEPSFDPQDDLDKVWEGFVLQYCSITRQELPASADVDEVKTNINAALASCTSADGKQAGVVMARLSACLQRFGEVLVGSASIVFGPSAQCWNAISSVLSAVQKYQALFDGFIALMERTSGFLDRVTVFLQDARGGCFLAPNLRRATYEILGHFLKVLANAYRVAHSRKEKLRLFAGVVMFADDGGVKADLDHLDRLMQNLLHTEVEEMGRDIRGIDRFLQDSERARQRHEAEMSQSAQRSEARLDDVHGSLSRAKLVHDLEVSEQAHQSHLGTIRESLFTGGVQRSQDTHKALRSSRLAGTGKWLLQNPVFQRWSDPDELELELMTLVGQAGYEKSYICSHVIDHLSTGSASCQVAYYYFAKAEGSNKLEDCLGSLILSIAELDKEYAQYTAQACRDRHALMSSENLWADLIAHMHNATERVYFLIIDGFVTASPDTRAKTLFTNLVSRPLSSGQRNNVRLFLSTTEDHVRQSRGCPVVLGTFQRQSYQGLQITQFLPERPYSADDDQSPLVNQDDLEVFVEDRVSILCEDADFRDIIGDLDVDIVTALVEGTEGDYMLLHTKLKELEACDTDAAVRDALFRAQEGRVKSLRRIISRLDGTLTQDEIAVLNEILLWLHAGYVPIAITVLQAILLAVRGTRYRLRTWISSKFSDLLVIDEEGTVWLAHGSRDVRAAMPIVREREESGAATNVPTAVSREETYAVEKLLQVECGPDLYNRLRIAEFLESRRTECAQHLGLPTLANGNEHILKVSLESLCDSNRKPSLQPLRSYAADTFPWKLRDVHLDDPQRAFLGFLGDKLSIMLSNTATIDTWCRSGMDVFRHPVYRLMDETCRDHLLNLLKHDYTREGYSSDSAHHEWLRSIIAQGGHPSRVLTRVAFRLASRYMCGETECKWDFVQGEAAVTSIWLGSGRRELLGQHHGASAEGVVRFLEWLRAQHPCCAETESAWQERKVRVLRDYSLEQEVLAAVNQKGTLPQDIEGVRTLVHLAACQRADWASQEALESIATAKKALANLHEDLSRCYESCHVESPRSRGSALLGPAPEEIVLTLHNQTYQAILVEEAKCLVDYHEFDEAAASLQMAIRADLAFDVGCRTAVESWGDEEATASLEARELLIQILDKRKRWECIVDELLFWGRGSKLGSAQAFAYRNESDRWGLRGVIIEAVWRTGRWGSVAAMYDSAIEDLQTLFGDANPKQLQCLEAAYALLLYHCSEEPSDPDRALDMLERCIETSLRAGRLAVPAECKVLPRLLLEKARTEVSTCDASAPSNQYTRRLERLAARAGAFLFQLSDFRPALARLYAVTGRQSEARRLLEAEMKYHLDKRHLREDLRWGARISLHALTEPLRVVGDKRNALACHLYDFKVTSQTYSRDNLTRLRADCDGRCGIVDATDVYHCLDCWRTVLCPACHQKNLEGTLCPTICSQTHEHIHITPEDVRKDALAGPDMVLVDGEAVPIEQWLDDLRREWKVDPASIQAREEQRKREAEASASIGRW